MTEADDLRMQIEELKSEVRRTKDQSRLYLQNVAHQLTAPLGAIKWSIEALKDEAVPIMRKGKLLSSVYSQSGILVHLIKNFSLMSNLEADEQLGQMIDQEPTDLLPLAINLANDFQPQAAEADKKIEVDDASFRRSLGRRLVKVERNLVAQAISNLLENAVKYSDIRTTISIKAAAADNGGVKLSVTSMGLPISPAERAAIFGRGFRGTTARQQVATGTGIGLYLASRVMHLHGGRIDLLCTGRTSCFELVFPKSRIQ